MKFLAVIAVLLASIADGLYYSFLRESNQTSISLYWEIGKLLAETTEQYQWGEQLYVRLSHDPSTLFKNTRGYSEQNLRRMRQFYCEYEGLPALLEIAKDVRWSTNLSIMHKVKKVDARKFYLEMAKETLRSRDTIDLQIIAHFQLFKH